MAPDPIAASASPVIAEFPSSMFDVEESDTRYPITTGLTGEADAAYPVLAMLME
jgi:hypothetical protein